MVVSIFARGRKKAFTLVELLVVIAIIALLLAILMPSLKRARTQAQTVVCGLHMRQYGLAIAQYISDNDDRFPPYCNQIVSSREAMFEPTVGIETTWINLLAPFLGGETVYSTDTPAVKRERSW